MPDKRIGSLTVEVEGKGIPLVMIHGLGGTSSTFAPLMEAADGFRVIRPDLPGAGRSALRPGQPGIKGFVSAVKDVLRALEVPCAHFVGHSMGTIVCQHLVVQNPDMAASMALFGPILEPPAAARAGLKERAATARKDGVAGIANAIAGGSVAPGHPAAAAFARESVLRQDPAGYAAHCEALSSAEAADLSKIKCPVTLVAGDKDPVAPVAMAEKMKAGLPKATLEIIPGVAHWMMMEAPERACEILRAHLDANR